MKYHPSEDAEHLRLLSIGHFVLAGITALVSLFPIIHLMIGIAILTGAIEPPKPPPGEEFPKEIFGVMFTVIPALIICGGMTIASLMAVSGWLLRQYRGYTYCLVMAGIECMFMPLGPVVGIFTFIVLLRPSVRELFGLPSYGKK